MKNLLTLCNDSSIVVKYLAIQFCFYDKDYQNLMFELQASMPGMGSAEYQTTIPLKFLIIISKYM